MPTGISSGCSTPKRVVKPEKLSTPPTSAGSCVTVTSGAGCSIPASMPCSACVSTTTGGATLGSNPGVLSTTGSSATTGWEVSNSIAADAWVRYALGLETCSSSAAAVAGLAVTGSALTASSSCATCAPEEGMYSSRPNAGCASGVAGTGVTTDSEIEMPSRTGSHAAGSLAGTGSAAVPTTCCATLACENGLCDSDSDGLATTSGSGATALETGSATVPSTSKPGTAATATALAVAAAAVATGVIFGVS